MRNRSVIAILAILAVFSMVEMASAQTGTVTVTGTNPSSVSITNTSDAAVSTTVALGTLTPTTGGVLATNSTTVWLRSSKAYVLSAQAAALNFTALGSVDNGTTIALSDIGFGVTTLGLTGANVANTGSRNDAVISKFDYTSGYPTVTNGLTPFQAGTNGTLNDITSNTQILSGSRISSLGNMSTDNNYIAVTLGVATLPQYFTPNTSFSSVVTLTITAP